jgi:hypothetical protein
MNFYTSATKQINNLIWKWEKGLSKHKFKEDTNNIYKKMFNVTTHQENTNQSYNDISLPTS